MNISHKAKTRCEVAAQLGMSYTTLYRKLKKKGVKLSPGLLNTEEIKKIYNVLGFEHQDIGLHQ